MDFINVSVLSNFCCYGINFEYPPYCSIPLCNRMTDDCLLSCIFTYLPQRNCTSYE